MNPKTGSTKSSYCNTIYHTLLIGLLVSATVIYALNLQFYASISKIHWNMKNLSLILRNFNFSKWKGESEILLNGNKTINIHSFARKSTILTTLPQQNTSCPWPPLYLRGREPLNRTVYDIEVLNTIHTFMKDGHYKPSNCTPIRKVAIVVPYRDREPQMKIFLNNVIPRIYRQQLEFGVYVVEQTPGVPFNRGMLSNIGFKEAMLDMDYDCIVIHDLDILPEDDRNFYICTDNPIHMAVKVQQFNYGLIYESFAGGVTTFSKEQFLKINGFPNQYFGWGGEDDDLYKRIKINKYKLTRPFAQYGHCGSVKHAAANKKNNRMEILRFAKKIWSKDGLNNLDYELVTKKKKQLYTWIFAKIDMEKVRKQLEGFVGRKVL